MAADRESGELDRVVGRMDDAGLLGDHLAGRDRVTVDEDVEVARATRGVPVGLHEGDAADAERQADHVAPDCSPLGGAGDAQRLS